MSDATSTVAGDAVDIDGDGLPDPTLTLDDIDRLDGAFDGQISAYDMGDRVLSGRPHKIIAVPLDDPPPPSPDELALSFSTGKTFTATVPLGRWIRRVAAFAATPLVFVPTLVLGIGIGVWGHSALVPAVAPPPPSQSAPVIERILTTPELRDMVGDEVVPYLERAAERDLGRDIQPVE